MSEFLVFSGLQAPSPPTFNLTLSGIQVSVPMGCPGWGLSGTHTSALNLAIGLGSMTSPRRNTHPASLCVSVRPYT